MLRPSRPRLASRIAHVAAVAWVSVSVALAAVAGMHGSLDHRLSVSLGCAALAGGGVWVARRQMTAAGLLGLVLGTVGVVAGAAIGVRYLLAGEVSGRSAAALVAFVAAAALLVASGALLIYPYRWTRRILGLAAMVVGVVVLGVVAAPGLLATNVPRVGMGTATPAERGIAFEDVTIETADGLTLVGWYVPSRNGAAVVLRHGTHATRANELDHLEPLVAAGFGVLVPDSRGHGGSEGNGMDFGWSGELDLRAAVQFLTVRPDVDPERIGVVGISLGGMEAVGAAGADPRIAAVVAEGVTRRSAADLGWLPEERGVIGGIQLGIGWLQTWVTELLADAPRPPTMAESVHAATGTRFLLVAADLDDERSSAAFIQRQAPDRTTVWVVPGAPRAGGMATAPDEWSRRVTGFLAETLLPAVIAERRFDPKSPITR
jgi:pimeloyl-ACP methyl ester carboxylesterase